MASVALALDDVGLAVPVQEALEAAGHHVLWDAALRAGAAASRGPLDLVVLASDRDLAARVEDWRDLDPPPALLAAGPSSAQDVARAAGVTFVAADLAAALIAGAVDRALAMRWTGRLSPAFARGGLGLPTTGDALRDAAAIITAARRATLELAREALRSHADQYAVATELVERLREARALTVPEIEVTRRLDGAHTVRTACAASSDPSAAMRLVWALCSVGAVSLGREPPDAATDARRAVIEARRHLRARRTRGAHTTAYDLLEIDHAGPPGELDQAVRALGIRFSTERLAALDLGDLGSEVAPIWGQIGKARALMGDPNLRNLHEAKIQRQPPPDATWWRGPYDSPRAEQHFARGQRALMEGEAFKAVSEFAAAARLHPDHPDYEVSLCWARYRADVARGKDKVETARDQRAAAELVTYGRRPWPRALVALALLCAAADDADAARWHLGEALACDPNLPAAQQLLGRLGR